MAQWWELLSVMQQIAFVVACATTLFMLGQIVMMLIGFGESDVDVDVSDVDVSVGGVADVDGALGGTDVGVDTEAEGVHLFGFKIFTIRSIIAFFSIGSWVAFTVGYVLDWPWALLIGIVAGLAAGLLMAYIMNALLKLQSSGNIEIGNSVGSVAEVYLTVPAGRSGAGKINLTLQERFVELGAQTDCEEAIETGAKVKVVAKIDDENVLVEPLGDRTRLSGN